MRSATSALLTIVLVTVCSANAFADLRDDVLRSMAKRFGLTAIPSPVEESALSIVGGKIFETKSLSFNGDTSCKTCHLDQFSSADGLPNAVGVGGHGEGPERLKSDGAIVPRNTLPLWGRGDADFLVFFWDGKVNGRGPAIISQFGDDPPSDDPLVVAAHLPFVEIREMVVDDANVSENYQLETVQAAGEVYDVLVDRLKTDDELATQLAAAHGIAVKELKFVHIAEAVAAFIRQKFQRRETKFGKFVFRNGTLTDQEKEGALIFYGRGRCILCHRGPHFTDFEFHTIAFPQTGFGKNGFGVDYGRYNITHDPDDLYKFRTAPLLNVANTSPYSHSGAAMTLHEAIVFHYDPLSRLDPSRMTEGERLQVYDVLSKSASSGMTNIDIQESDLGSLVDFLATLTMSE